MDTRSQILVFILTVVLKLGTSLPHDSISAPLYFPLSTGGSLPPLEDTPDSSTETTTEVPPPLIFPETGVPFVNNETLMANLTKLTEEHDAVTIPGVVMSNKTHEEKDSSEEADDMTREREPLESVPGVPPREDLTTTTDDPALDAEEIVTSKPLKEDLKMAAESDEHATHEHRQLGSTGSSTGLVEGQLAAIMAGVFVVIAVLGYIGLLTWRKFLEIRYGNREMLINEEDFYDPTDVRHFEL